MMDDFFDFENWLKGIVIEANEQKIEHQISGLPTNDEVDLDEDAIHSLMHIAVDNNDRQYFEELKERSNKL